MIDQTITVLAFLTFFMMACLAAFGIWDEKWFQFGPNDHLTFLKITIDTSGKYILLVTLLIFTYAMKAIGDMYVDPWIKARHVGLISENFTDEWLLIHVILWRIYSWVMLLLCTLRHTTPGNRVKTIHRVGHAIATGEYGCYFIDRI